MDTIIIVDDLPESHPETQSLSREEKLRRAGISIITHKPTMQKVSRYPRGRSRTKLPNPPAYGDSNSEARSFAVFIGVLISLGLAGLATIAMLK